MNSILTANKIAEPTPKEAAELQAAMTEMYVHVEKSFARMDADWAEIDRLKAETRLNIDAIKQAMKQ